MCFTNGSVSEFNLSTGWVIRVLPNIFYGYNQRTILKVGRSDFAITTDNGLFVVDLKIGKIKMHLLLEKDTSGMCYLGNGQLIVGTN